jgi:Xaa-Pro aminopeptidase
MITDMAIQKLLEKLYESNVDGALVSSYANVLYYSGFTGSNGTLLIFKDSLYLITDFRYVEQAKIESPRFNVIEASAEKASEFINCVCSENGIKTIWFEDEHIPYKTYRNLSEALKAAELVPANDGISSTRVVKTDSEISIMRRAASLADSALTYISKLIKTGMTEKQAALEIEIYLRRNCGVKAAFDIIVASGRNAALPHAQPTDKLIGANDHVIFDFGAVIDGYRSDMTRTLIIGDPEPEVLKIYNIVLEAQLKALHALKPGVVGKEIDRIAREHIEQNGYGKYFGHGLGHGVGLNIHEGPRLSEKSTDVLEVGMVVTIEPGIYLPGVGGVRIEDMVVITENGMENLTSSPKYLRDIKALLEFK